MLFTDLVGNSQLPSREQRERVQRLTRIILARRDVKLAEPGRPILRPTGDGIAVAFFGSPVVAVRCAMQIAQAIHTHRSELPLRMGLNSGLVDRSLDANKQEEITGPGINMAKRVMDCGSARHILLSRALADMLRDTKEWDGWLHDIGERRVKNDVVHVVNLWRENIGRRFHPKSVRISRRVRLPLRRKLLKPKSLVLDGPTVPFKHGQNAYFYRQRLLKTTRGFAMKITLPSQPYWRCGFVLSPVDYIHEGARDIGIGQYFLFHVGQGLATSPTTPPIPTGLNSQFYYRDRGETPVPFEAPSPVELRVRFDRRRQRVLIDVGGEHHVKPVTPSDLHYLYVLAWADYYPPCRIQLDLGLQ